MKNGLHYLGDMADPETVVYPVGKHIAVKNLKNGSMKFIQQKEDVREITGIYLSKGSNRRFLAVTVKLVNDIAPYVQIYDLKTLSGYEKPKCEFNVLDVAYESKSK